MFPKKWARYIIVFIILLFLILCLNRIYNTDILFKNVSYNENIPISLTNIKIKQHLLKALRYVRNGNARAEILEAISIISGALDIERVSKEIQTIGKVGLQDVCLDKYLGRIDHPLYNKGQGETNCKRKPFADVLTFVMMAKDCGEVDRIVRGVRNDYKESKIVFGVTDGQKCVVMDTKVSTEGVSGSAEDSVRLLKRVSTDFVLFAPNIYHFDNQSHIERLVRMVSYTDADIAAGGLRPEDGHYRSGCYQMAMKMYTLKLVHGYDMSFNSCLYCDYSPAPFVSRTHFLMEQFTKLTTDRNVIIRNNTALLTLQLFANLMIAKRPQILVCPDVLFHVKPYDLSMHKRQQWFPFVSWFSLNRVLLDGGKDMNFSCAESTMTCYKKKGLMVPLCCLKELSQSLKFMNRLLEQQNVTFEVLEGTVMGGLKFNNILLWELDADTNYRVRDIDRLEAKLDVLRKQGYTMTLTYECPYKRDHEKCRHAGWHGSIYYAYRTPNWRTEMYGVTYILSDFRGELKEPTRISIDGEWYITYTNPVLYARNIYGGDVFRHVEHALALGLTDAHYTTALDGTFSKCPQPGFHGCLDNFAAEGSLQFQDIYI